MNTQRAIRRSMKETAFRRYEPWIAQACKGTIVVDPVDLVPPCKASSFIVGVREAIRGYRMFDYTSTKIPPMYETRRIRVFENEEGKVCMENLYEDKVGMMKMTGAAATEVLLGPSITVDEYGSLIAQQNPRLFKDKVEDRIIDYQDIVETAEWIVANQDKWQLSPVENIRIVKIRLPEEEEVLKGLEKSHYPVVVERLQHGWWRMSKV